MEKSANYRQFLQTEILFFVLSVRRFLQFLRNTEMREEHAIGFDAYDLSTEDMIPRENTVITMTKLGYIKSMTVDNFRSQNRGGRGIKGMQTLKMTISKSF